LLKAIRAILIAINIAIGGILGSVLCLLRPFHPSNALISGRLLSFWGLPILGLKVTVTQSESPLHDGPCIYVANHQDLIDLFVCGKAVSKRTVSMGKKSLIYIPFFGALYWLSGNILIDRKNARKAVITMDQKTREKLTEKNTSIWIFPEGTRNPTTTLLPFKRGAFRTAIKAKVPIIPVCISSYAYQADYNQWRSRPIKVSMLDPIPTDHLKPRDSEELAKQCREIMQNTINQMNTELRILTN